MFSSGHSLPVASLPVPMATSNSEITVCFVNEISNFRVANKNRIISVDKRKKAKWVFLENKNSEDDQGNFSLLQFSLLPAPWNVNKSRRSGKTPVPQIVQIEAGLHARAINSLRKDYHGDTHLFSYLMVS